MGGTMAALRKSTRVIADFARPALASGNIERSSASAPVTKGVAALVPLEVNGCLLAPRLVIPSPGAIRPRRAIELPRLETARGLPARSQATTGMTQGWRVIAEPPTVP